MRTGLLWALARPPSNELNGRKVRRACFSIAELRYRFQRDATQDRTGDAPLRRRCCRGSPVRSCGRNVAADGLKITSQLVAAVINRDEFSFTCAGCEDTFLTIPKLGGVTVEGFLCGKTCTHKYHACCLTPYWHRGLQSGCYVCYRHAKKQIEAEAPPVYEPAKIGEISFNFDALDLI